jgi:hypothetical protein
MRPTLLFYNVYRETILLVKGRILLVKGRMLLVNELIWHKKNICLYEYLVTYSHPSAAQ